MTGTESPVESWVGEAKRLWSPIQGGNAGTMANRLFLRVSGVRGDFSDDAFVEQLAVDMLGPREISEERAGGTSLECTAAGKQ